MSTETGGGTEAEELLKAGAVLPPGTDGGDRAVPLTARTYRHPALDGRLVVRLVAGELGMAEDLAAGFLGLEPDGEPAEVGLGLRQALGFPEWVLVHHPKDGHHALAMVPELKKATRQIKSKPKNAMDACQALADRLAVAVPHFLPTFYEEVGRAFLGADNATYAAQVFGKARAAEASHGLAIDEERLDAVFLEFALAGALPVKTLSGYAKELARRVPADEALRRFRRLCVRRTAGGLQPSAQMATDLRRLAKAAGTDGDTEEQGYLAELLELPPTMSAALGWWKAHRAALVALARREPGIRGKLLDLMPEANDSDLCALWLEILEESGATEGLGSGDIAAELRPADGTAGWLRRFHRARLLGWRGSAARLPALYPLVERVADRLRAELTQAGEELDVISDLDLLDLLLALDVPVRTPGRNEYLPLERWADGEGQRDLLAVSKDERFGPAFHGAAERFGNDRDGQRAIHRLVGSPGGRPMLAAWVRDVAARPLAAGLPALPAAISRLTWLPGEALALAEQEVTAAASADLATELARTLRGGLFDELGWPEWDQAVADLAPVRHHHGQRVTTAEAWPHLVVAGDTRVRVLGPEGVALEHDLRVNRRELSGQPGFHYVDGELLVFWRYNYYGDLHGYWHTAAGEPQRLEGSHVNVWQPRGNDTISLALPGGGRTTGGGVLHRGDTALPAERPVATDGTSYWVWLTSSESGADRSGWHEYDPATGSHGRPAGPSFLADAVSGWLRPAPSDTPSPFGVPVNGLVGWRVTHLPDRSVGEDLSGRTVTVGNAEHGRCTLRAALTFPGDDRPRALAHSWRSLSIIDPDGVITAVADEGSDGPGDFSAGTPLLPPTEYWHYLRPRDPDGSTALRRADRDTAAALLKGAAAVRDDKETGRDGAREMRELIAVVRDVLPQIGDAALAAGIAGVVRYTATEQDHLDQTAVRLRRALSGEQDEDEQETGPRDVLLQDALDGLSGQYNRYQRQGESRTAAAQLRMIGAAVREPAALRPEGRVPRSHFEGRGLPSAQADWSKAAGGCAAVAFRAASQLTSEEHRAALTELLGELDALGMTTNTSRWRRCTFNLDHTQISTLNDNGNWCALWPTQGADDTAFLAVIDTYWENGGRGFTAVHHDPSGRFDVPEPYRIQTAAPLGEDRAEGWCEAFLDAAAERGPAPWRPAAAERFAELTGVTATMARLVVAGLPFVDSYERNFLPPEVRTALGVKAADAAVARGELRDLAVEVRRALVGALLPADPVRLWTEGPDVDAAAALWIEKVGRRVPVPEALLGDASRTVRIGWHPSHALPALLEPAASAPLSRDLNWGVRGDRVVPLGEDTRGFTADTLVSVVALAAWTAHRLPAGDPIRAALAPALAVVRERLANPTLALDLNRYVSLPEFRKAAGTPTETGDGFERYGAVLMATHDDQPSPALLVRHLDPTGSDPFLPALRGAAQQPFPAEVALRVALDPGFAELLGDPGDPVAGERGKDGSWWPQDPSRSVPGLVAEAAARHQLGADAAAVYLMLLAMPDPVDRSVARWTGWKPARLKAARAELAATDLVVEATRTRAGRSLFLPGGWTDQARGLLPLEQWKLPLFGLTAGQPAPLGVVVPFEPAAALYRRAWQRVLDGDPPRYAELKVRAGRGRGRRR